ncbi:MAG: helix-turn-helix domain-containing protein [Mariprofundaceae bacterium]
MNDQLEACSEQIGDATSQEELLCELANCLKNRRESQNLTLEEIAISLKLRTVYLKALESGNWDDMPGEVYAIAFLKQYAAFLDLDISESIEKLKTGQYKLTKPLTFPDPPIAPNKTWVIVAALLFIVLFILFNLFDDGFDDNETNQRDLPSVEMTKTTPVPVVEKPLKVPDEIDITEDIPAAASSAESIEPQPDTTSEETPETAIQHEYKLTAVGDDVWLQLSLEGASGEEPFLLREALLRDGQSTTLHHASPYLLLTCGNATFLQVHIDGQLIIATGSLGESDKVLRNFKLTSDH